MADDDRVRYTAYMKYLTAAALTAAWVLAAWTGFMPGVIPHSAGGDELILGYARGDWSVIHSWLSAVAIGITAVEIIISRKSLREGLRHLATAESKQDA